MKTILFQGDSITDCNRLREDVDLWNGNHRYGTGYVNLVTAKLLYEYTERDFTVVNRGIAGNRIRDLYARMGETIINIKPDLLTILIGINEVWCEMNAKGKSEPKYFKLVYKNMLEEISEKLSAKIILIEPFVLKNEKLTGGYDEWEARVAPLRVATKEIAEEFNADFIPMQDRFNELSKIKGPTYWSWDGVHPTIAGHAAIADEWLNFFKNLEV